MLTVGRWASAERYKGIDELIHATALLRAKPVGLHLVVVGEGDDLPRLRELAIDGGVADSVHFLGRVRAEELAACYASADVFALPSSGEGFGLVFLEAMAFAKPIVGSACGGTTDLVGHGVNGLLVPPGDIPKLADALESLLENPPLRTTLGRRGAQLIGERYRFEGFKIELAQILTEASVSGVDSGNTRSNVVVDQNESQAGHMNPKEFEWTPDFWQGWRESDNPYRQYKSRRDRQLVWSRWTSTMVTGFSRLALDTVGFRSLYGERPKSSGSVWTVPRQWYVVCSDCHRIRIPGA